MNAQKQMSAKAWAADQTKRRLAAEAEARQKNLFLKIACLGLQIKEGSISRSQAATVLNDWGVTREDLAAFQRWHSPAAPTRSESSAPTYPTDTPREPSEVAESACVKRV